MKKKKFILNNIKSLIGKTIQNPQKKIIEKEKAEWKAKNKR